MSETKVVHAKEEHVWEFDGAVGMCECGATYRADVEGAEIRRFAPTELAPRIDELEERLVSVEDRLVQVETSQPPPPPPPPA